MTHFENLGHHLLMVIIEDKPNGWVMFKLGHLMTHVWMSPC